MEFLLNHAYSIYFAIAAFLIFFVLLAKFGVGPIVAAIDAREQKIAGDLKEAEAVSTKAKQLKEQLDAQLRSAEAKIGEMMAEARRDAEAHKASLVEAGRTEVEAMRGRIQRDIEAARQTAIVSLRAQIAEIATGVAEKVLRERLDAGKQEQLVAQAVDAYERSGRR